jgi:poly(A) polymerase
MNADAVAIVGCLREHGHRAYLVGGCVRDHLLGRVPKDYDVATDARPELIMSLFPRTIAVGARFGVIIVRRHRRNFEVATFREDLGYTDGRHPDQVCFGSPRADARRRDFTINGLFLDPLTGEIIDYVGGRRDLDRRLIRAIGDPDARFTEDKLRMIRAVRFAARLGWRIETKTRAAIARRAAEINSVSAERIHDELNLILTGERPALGLQLLEELGLLAALLPEVQAMKGMPQPPEVHPEGDVFTHTLIMLERMKLFHRRPAFALAVLLHDVGKPPTYQLADRIRFNQHDQIGAELAEQMLRRLRFPNAEIATVTALVKEHMRFINVKDMRPAKLKRFLRQPDFNLHLELHRLDCLASHGDISNYTFCRRKLRGLSREREPLRPPRLLTGHDLIALGLAPGPRFAAILTALEDAQLEGEVTTREQAMAWVHQRIKVGT